MAGEDNLHSFAERTVEERRELARKAGIASGEARRAKRDLRIALEMLLDKEFPSKDGTKSGAELIAFKQFQKALDGDTRAFEVIRDTAGQKPVDRVQIAEIDQNTIDEVERMVLEHDKATSD